MHALILSVPHSHGNSIYSQSTIHACSYGSEHHIFMLTLVRAPNSHAHTTQSTIFSCSYCLGHQTRMLTLLRAPNLYVNNTQSQSTIFTCSYHSDRAAYSHAHTYCIEYRGRTHMSIAFRVRAPYVPAHTTQRTKLTCSYYSECHIYMLSALNSHVNDIQGQSTVVTCSYCSKY